MSPMQIEPFQTAEADRIAVLSQLVPLWPHEIADRSVAGQERICRLLRHALRQERQRGIGGHWTYDLTRHAALSRTLVRELRKLEHMYAAAKKAAGRAGMPLQSVAAFPG